MGKLLEKYGEKIFTSLKSLKKGVGSGSGSAPKCHRSRTLVQCKQFLSLVQAKADKKGEKEEEEDEVGSVTSEEFNTFLDAMGGRAKERTDGVCDHWLLISLLE